MSSRSPYKQTIGLIVSIIFTLSYIAAPLYIISSLIYLAVYPSISSIIYISPLIISFLTPVIKLPWLVKHPLFMCICDYFDFECVHETTDEKLLQILNEMKKQGRSCLFVGAPHGVVSFGGICAGADADPRFNSLVTAAAGAVLATPIVKHVVGVFGLIDASAPSLTKHLARGGVEGSVVLYAGGIAELFKCSTTEERLYLKARKGFIKLALRTGADVIPQYFFGNTSVLSIIQNRFLETLSRKYQVSLTIFWGRWGLPIPRQHKIMYVRAPPMGMPHIKNPTDEDVDKWHKKYMDEISRIFEKYKHRVPHYADKELIIE